MKRTFFKDTYGWDNLSKFLVLVSLPFMFSRYTFMIGVVLAGYGAIRVISRNTEKRRQEERAFEGWLRRIPYKYYVLKQRLGLNNIRGRINGTISRLKERRYYIIFKCPNCGQKLRLPRHKGTVMATCRRCSHRFRKRT